MIKRSFWLIAAALGAWLLWQWMQQRRDEMTDHSPQLAPHRPFIPPADDDQVAAVTVPPPAPAAPAAPPPPPAAAPDALFAPADDDQVGAPPAPPSDAALDALFAPADDQQPAATAETRATDLAAAVAAALEEADAPADRPPASAPDTHGAAAESGAPIEDEVLGYCVRCRAKRPMQHPHEEFSESGRRAARGTCPECGATMFTFLAASDEEQGASA